MRESLIALAPYRAIDAPGLPLHSNINRLGPNPAAQRLAELLPKINLNDYPSSNCQELRQALAVRHDLEPDWFLIGNGSDEVFDLIFKTFLDPGKTVAFPSPTYSMYRHYALANAANPVEVPLDEAFDLDGEAVLNTDSQLIVICTPNNPTGNRLSPDAIEKILQSGRLTVIDEAYGDFVEQGWLSCVREYLNLLVTRTFSKAYGLAGLRVGYVVGNPQLIEQIQRVRLPYNVNAISQAIAALALNEQEFVREYVALIRAERPRWEKVLTERGFRVWPSETNFLLAEAPLKVNRDRLIAQLAQAGVLVRPADPHPRLERSLRITVGTSADRAVLLNALDEVLP